MRSWSVLITSFQTQTLPTFSVFKLVLKKNSFHFDKKYFIWKITERMNQDAAVLIQNASKAYDEKDILKNFHMTVPRGCM